MNATLTPVRMEQHVLILVEPTSAHALQALMEPTVTMVLIKAHLYSIYMLLYKILIFLFWIFKYYLKAGT